MTFWKIRPRFGSERRPGGPQRWANANHREHSRHTTSRALLKVKGRVLKLFITEPGKRSTNPLEYIITGRHSQIKRGGYNSLCEWAHVKDSQPVILSFEPFAGVTDLTQRLGMPV